MLRFAARATVYFDLKRVDHPYNRLSVHISRRCWRRGQKNKTSHTTESIFRSLFFRVTGKPTTERGSCRQKPRHLAILFKIPGPMYVLKEYSRVHQKSSCQVTSLSQSRRHPTRKKTTMFGRNNDNACSIVARVSVNISGTHAYSLVGCC